MHTFIAAVLVGGINCPTPEVGPELFRNGFEIELTQAFEGETFATAFAPLGMNAGQTYLPLRAGEYMSLPLNVPNAPLVSQLIWDQWINSPSSVRIAVSFCPGFPQQDDTLAVGRCFVQEDIPVGTIRISSNPNESPQDFCNVEQGETVWVNIAYVDDTDIFACNAEECGPLFGVYGSAGR